MVGVIVGSKKTGINPDNVATPIAASFGDLITLAILAWISQGLYSCLLVSGVFDVLNDSPKALSFSYSLTAMPASSALPEQATWTKWWNI